LQAYGYTLAVVYVAIFFYLYKAGMWVANSAGTPILNDFTFLWIAGRQALLGETPSLYDPAAFAKVQAAVSVHITSFDLFYPNFPYPPIFLLIMAPLAMLPCAAAFLTFGFVTLLGFAAAVFLIVRRPAAIALALAWPLTFWNFGYGQTGFLRASLVGAALLALERRPVLAGVFIGCLTYKPQFGILFPGALVAARQWRAFASAAITVGVLAGVSAAAFGLGPWEAFPGALIATGGEVLINDFIGWTHLQTVFGLVRVLDGGAALAWLAQGCATAGVAIIVWLVWRSPVRYPLKAALLSAATLLATPYGATYDLTVIAIPVAFLARDQIRCGLLRGEQSIMIALFAACVLLVVCGGSPPIGPVMVMTLLGIILRRSSGHGPQPISELEIDRQPATWAA
jgi:hypothetical protein